MITYIIYLGLFLFLFRFILKPFVELLLIKLSWGKEAKLHFVPIFGYMWMLNMSQRKFNDHFEQIRRYFRENKALKFLLINQFHRPMIFIGDPEYNRIVYIEHDNFERVDLLNTRERLLGSGLIFSYGKKWKQQRNLLRKPFDYDKLKSRIPLMNEINSLVLLQERLQQTFFGNEVKGSKLNNREIQEEIVEMFTDIADIVCNTFYGFIKWQLFGELQWKIFPNKAEKHINRRITLLHDFSETVKKNIDEFDFLDYHLKELLDEQNISQVTEREIMSQFVTLLFGGTDTTSTLVALCLFYLVKYPTVRDSLLKEIQLVVGEGNVLDWQKFQEVNSFIQEVFRQRNPTTGPLVKIAKTDIMIKDLKIKKGWLVLPSNYVQQWNDKYFDNYEQFDAKRFLKPDVIKNDNGFVNVPFSAGPRNCIGQHMAMMETKIMLCHILRQYNIIEVPENMKNLKWKSTFLYSFDPPDCIKLVKK